MSAGFIINLRIWYLKNLYIIIHSLALSFEDNCLKRTGSNFILPVINFSAFINTF